MQNFIPNLKLGIAFLVFLALSWLSVTAVAQSVDKKPLGEARQASKPLSQIVRIIVNRETNQITLIGTPEDVETVKRAIESLNRNRRQRAAPVVSEKVVLYRELAENVASVMKNTQPAFTRRQGKLTITPLHTPEAIFLTGPPVLVEWAKKFIATLDH